MIPGVPYDAEIEYLESVGEQWIDTGVSAVWPGLRVELDMLLFAHSTNEVNFFGATDFGGAYFNYAGGFNSLNSFVLQLGHNYVKYGVQDASRHLHIYDSPNNRAWLDNAYFSWSTWPSVPSDTFKLFQRINKGNNAHPSHNRMWGAKFSRDGVLVRDFIPVRVGQTGYMYDRVTKRLFGNQGTGSFVLGPDVAKPVIGLYGMRKFYNAKDYVQDGLVAMWDGIENVGFGMHDGNSTTWTDLCRLNTSLPKFTLAGDDKWEDNACEISDKHLVGNGYLTNYFITLNVDWSIATFEYCFTCKNVSTASGDMIMLASYRGGPLLLTNVWNFLRVTCGGNGNYGAEVPNAFNMIPYIGKSLQGTFSASSTGFSFRGEVVKPDLKTNIPQPVDFRYGFYFGALGKNLTNVHSVRIYSRTLTVEEIAHNYAIDKARFNLP